LNKPVSIDSIEPSGVGFRTDRSLRHETFATVVVVIALIAAMEITSRYVPDYIMPSPLAVLDAAQKLFLQDYTHVFVTILRLIAAVAFAMLLGVLFGVVMGMLPAVRPYLRALVIIDTGVPALSWMLIAIFWFKDPETRIIFILVVILLPFYALNVYEGIRALPKDLLDMVESFRPTRWQVLRYLVGPHIVQYVFLTTKSVIGYAIRMTIFAELIASAIGVGSRMGLAHSNFQIDQLLAWTFFLIALSLSLQAAINAIEKRFLRWRPELEVR
jgi:NitT/TauT family transport system permease protein